MGGGKKSKAPKAPDYTALAAAQAKADKETAAYTTAMDRPTQTSPLGSSTWKFQGTDINNPKPGDWVQTTTLTPEQQAIFNAEQSNNLGLQQLGGNVLGQAQGTLGQPFNPNLTDYYNPGEWQGSNVGLPQNTLSGMQDMAESSDVFQQQNQQVRDALYQQLTRFNEDRFGKQENAQRSRLLGMGLQEGSEAYNNAMREFERTRNEAYDNAGLQSILAGGQEQSRLFADMLAGRASNIGLRQGQFGQDLNRYTADLNERQAAGNYGMNLANLTAGQRQQQLQEQAFIRDLPLNEIASLMSGSGVQMPTFTGFAPSTKFNSQDMVGGANANYQAAMGQYNAGQQQKGSLLGAGLGFAGSLLGGK